MLNKININPSIRTENPYYNRNTNNSKNLNFGHASSDKTDIDSGLKTKVAVTTGLSVAAMVAAIAKKQGFKLNPKTIFTQNPKDWAIFKIPNSNKTNGKILKLEEGEIISIGGASVLGGLAGGIAFDKKENRKAKLKESLNQMLGCICVPLAFVAVPSRLYKKYSKEILKFVPQIKNNNNSKLIKYTNRTLSAIPATAMTLTALGAGIIAGNKVSNFINEKVYKQKVDRDIKATDFAPHVDDLCLAISLIASESSAGNAISKLVPFALLVAGNEVGKAQEKTIS
ncbi:hypothetical protein J6E39_01175 [bacterium]|nr:hypothetical protein [bacterium]